MADDRGRNVPADLDQTGERDEPPEAVSPEIPSDVIPEVVDGKILAGPAKTPFFQASNTIRYQRQAIIKHIEYEFGRQLISYVGGIDTSIDRDDPVKIVDLLHNVRSDEDLDFILQTPGGDINAAHKIMNQIRSCVGSGRLRVIVPDYAKSAGTLMAIAADAIVMSDMSELGPIDPQVIVSDGDGTQRYHSVMNYLDAYDELVHKVNTEPNNEAARIMLGRLSPVTVKLFQSIRNRAQQIAEDHLKAGMFKDTGNWSLTASNLIDTKKWPSHGQMISWQTAQTPDLDLVVEYLEPTSAQWSQYWQLFCLQLLAIADDRKLFESNYASLLVPG